MFGVTFLGHQGWMIRSGDACVLVDPLLNEKFGEIHALEYSVHPPRVLEPEAFPAIDAVLLSHEHDDHFDIPSLARLDRRIPIFMSAHSSSAAFAILREMGFAVGALVPGVPLDLGELEVIPFSGDHVSVNCADEWDALPLLIRDKRGAGSFFTMVDVMLLPGHVEWVKAHAPRPGLVTWSNNALDWSHMGEGPARDVGTEQCFRSMGAGRQLIVNAWGTPAAMLVCAGGFAFQGEQAWFNQRVFWVDTNAVCRQLSVACRNERFYSALPGQTFWMKDHRLAKVEESTPFLATVPRHQWPVRGRIARPEVPDYSPATARCDLADGEENELRRLLNELAQGLVGGILFRSLHSLLAVEAEGRKPTFALVLRQGTKGAASVYEYDASSCAFVAGVQEKPQEAYLAGLECWETDMLSVLRAEMGPIVLMFGRARLWNALPHRFRFDFLEGLTKMSHPLTRPAEYLRNYRRLWHKHSGVAPQFTARLSNVA
jgi:hypothetical protein